MFNLKKIVVTALAAFSLFSFNNASITKTNAITLDEAFEALNYSNIDDSFFNDFTSSKYTGTRVWSYGDFNLGSTGTCPVAGCYECTYKNNKNGRILITPKGDVYFYNYFLSSKDIEFTGQSQVSAIFNVKPGNDGKYIFFVNATDYWDGLDEQSKPDLLRKQSGEQLMAMADYASCGLQQSIVFKEDHTIAAQFHPVISFAHHNYEFSQKRDYSSSINDFVLGDVVNNSWYDSKVDITDLTALQLFIIDGCKYNHNGNFFYKMNADLNFDGNFNVMDVVLLRRHLSKDESFSQKNLILNGLRNGLPYKNEIAK